MKNLIYDLMEAAIAFNENRHAQIVMKELGITYSTAVPRSISDSWWFFNCEIPEYFQLPGFIRELKVDPMKCIGYGLSQEMAEKIINIQQTHEDQQ